MRPGEVSDLDVDDIIAKPTGVLVTVRRSKTDQDARGQLVGVARGGNPLTDPIRALDAWLAIRSPGAGSLSPESPITVTSTTQRIG